MYAYWYRSNAWNDECGNIGDIISPIIIEYMSGVKPEWKPEGGNRLLCCGSIITLLQDNDTIWGSGLIKSTAVPYRKNVRINMVRGPITKKYLVDSGYKNISEIFCDPSVIFKEIYHPKIAKKYELGIIPHYVEKEETMQKFKDVIDNNSIKIIDIINNPYRFVNEILECKNILSSSLHGLILSESYDLNARYYQLTNKIIGGKFKYDDYYLSTNREIDSIEIPDKIKNKEIYNIIENIENTEKPIFNIKYAKENFPKEW